MTTVAYKDGILACDSLVTDENERMGAFSKIARLPSGALFAMVGDLAQAQFFYEWAKGGFQKDKYFNGLSNLATPSFTCVHISKKGVVTEYNDSLIPVTYKAKAYAWGSGHAFALGRMDAPDGTAVQGIKTAKKFDVFTGGKIKTLSLEE